MRHSIRLSMQVPQRTASFAACVFRDVAADGAGPGAGGIGGKDQPVFCRVLHRLFGDDSSLGFHYLSGCGAAVCQAETHAG